MKKYLLVLVILSSLVSAFAAPDVVFQAMSDEMKRTMDSLNIEGMSKPYFSAYRISDGESVNIEGEDGTLTKTTHAKSRYLSMEIRVGSMARDNGWFAGSANDLYNMPRSMPVENEYNTLRHQLWLATDKAYKNAQENLGRKSSYYQSHPEIDSLPDFSAADTSVALQEPVTLSVDKKQWAETIRQICDAIKKHTGINEWRAIYNAQTLNKRYLNSEHSQALSATLIQTIQLSATAQATDGQRLVASREWFLRDDDKTPTRAELLKIADEFTTELEAMAKANTINEYSGPVIFTGDASAQLFSQVFLYNLTPIRKIAAVDDYIDQHFPAGKYAQRLNRRVLPDFLSIVDNPTQSTWNKSKLFGYRLVDDEGVKPQKLTLVDNGKLVTLPTSRTPAKRMLKSNGHARLLQNQWIIPSVTNVFVQAKGAVSYDELVNKLRTMCRESGAEYGLLIKQLDDPQLSQDYSWGDPKYGVESDPLTAPSIMYKVYEKDGRLEPVRGLQFDEVSIRSLRDIAAVGTDDALHNINQQNVFSMRSLVSLVIPSVLIDEMELKTLQQQEPLYKSERPVAKK